MGLRFVAGANDVGIVEPQTDVVVTAVTLAVSR